MLKRARNSGEITLDLCKKKSKDDIIIIYPYATLEFEEAKRSSPGLFFQMKRQLFNLMLKTSFLSTYIILISVLFMG
jgi:hypothetical protein